MSNNVIPSLLLSICVMTHNRACLLKKTIHSILANNPTAEVEIVISDNCSTDETEEVCRLFSSNPQIRYFRNESNSGFDGNVIHCIKRARGKYIWLFSDDDIMPPDVLDYVLSYLKQNITYNLVYIAHYSFLDGEPYTNVYRRYYPNENQEFNSGFDMFKTAGFGFISSLIFNTYLAQQELNVVTAKYNNAHIELALKIALSKQGNCLFIGKKSVAARMPQVWSRKNMLRDGYINTLRIYDNFVQLGLLSSDYVHREKRKVVFNTLPRFIISAYISGEPDSVKPLQADLKSVFPSTFHRKLIDFYYFIAAAKPAIWLLKKAQLIYVSQRKRKLNA